MKKNTVTEYSTFLPIDAKTLKETIKADYMEMEVKNIKKLYYTHKEIALVNWKATIEQRLLSARKMRDLKERLYVEGQINEPEKDLMDATLQIFYRYLLSLSCLTVAEMQTAAKDYETFLNLQ